MRRGGRWLMDDPHRRHVYDALNAAGMRALGTTIRSGPARGLRFQGGDTAGYILGLSEPEVQRALVAHLRPGDVYFDVGTHAGFLAVLGSRLVGAAGQVHCFEPVPANVAILNRNVAANASANTTVHVLALSDYDGTATMATGHRNITASLSDGDGEEVRVARLDSLDLPAATVVKIDVEGAESSVLRGMATVLHAHHPTLIIEIHGDQLKPVTGFLRGAGYTVDALNTEGMPHILATPE
jgi:FkbM family methyltransferase